MLPIPSQCLRCSIAPVQRPHQQLHSVLTKRPLAQQGLEPPHRVRRVSQLKSQPGPLLLGVCVHQVKSAHLSSRRVPICEVRVCRPPPQLQGHVKEGGRLPRLCRHRLSAQSLEPACVHPVGWHVEPVAAGLCHDRVAAEMRPKSGDHRMQRGPRVVWPVLGPRRLDERLGRDGFGDIQEQADQRRPAASFRHGDGAAVAVDPQRPQHLEGEASHPPIVAPSERVSQMKGNLASVDATTTREDNMSQTEPTKRSKQPRPSPPDPRQERGRGPALAHLVAAGEGEHLRFSGMEVLVRASTESTGGAFTVLEEIDPIDVPMHVHHGHDELFYVLEGEHVITVGDTGYHAGPGDLVFGPRGVPHAQERLVPRVGRILTLFTPGGFEGFFRELAEGDLRGVVDSEFLDRIAARHQAAWVHPAPQVRS